MKRRNFFKALGIAAVTPSILLEVANVSKPWYIERLLKIRYTQGIIPFLRGDIKKDWDLAQRPNQLIWDDMGGYTQEYHYPISQVSLIRDKQSKINYQFYNSIVKESENNS